MLSIGYSQGVIDQGSIRYLKPKSFLVEHDIADFKGGKDSIGLHLEGSAEGNEIIS